MPSPEKQYHRDGLPINRERLPYSGDLKFEDALEYLVQVAFEHKGEEPIVISLFGAANAGKTKFVKELIEKVWNKNPGHKVSVYGIAGGSEEQFKTFAKFKKQHEDIKFSMLVWDTTTNAPPDLQSVMYLKRFPDTLVYMYDPKKGKIQNRQAMLVHFLEVRRKIAEQFNVPYGEPEFLVVQNPEAKVK